MTPEASRNIDFVGHTDNAGHGDCVQVMVSRGHAYLGTRTSRGVNVTDVRDPRSRGQSKLVAHRNWCPPFGGGTHSALPLHDRALCVVADEATQNIDQEQMKRIWMFDLREKANPVSIATFPIPREQDYVAKGGQFFLVVT